MAMAGTHRARNRVKDLASFVRLEDVQTALAAQPVSAAPSTRRRASPPDAVAAATSAAENAHAMARALTATQPQFSDVTAAATDAGRHPWTYARDGSLTVRTAGDWWAGCSLPARASVQQLRSLDARGPTACFLDPPHPAYLRTALGMLGPSQAVVALVPDPAALPVLLAADDLSAEVAAGRLWFAAGSGWAEQLRALFRDRPGLTPPTQFIRLTLPDSARLDPLIAEARQVLVDINAERSAAAAGYKDKWRAGCGGRLCVVTARGFRLGDEAGLALAEVAAAGAAGSAAGGVGVLGGVDVLCGDDPATSSTLELLRRATACNALLTADFARAELPDLLPTALPWVTWVTSPRIPLSAAAGPNDRLIVADPAWVSAARSAGWPAAAVTVGGWPAALGLALDPATASSSTTGPTGSLGDAPAAVPATAIVPHPHGEHVAVVADTAPLDPPARLEEFSSHRLLWNAIRDELSADPLAVGTDAEGYLTARVGRFDVDPAGLDRTLFVRGLIEPTVAQAVVRRLVADGVPVRAHGAGWDQVPGCAAAAAGLVSSRAGLVDAVRAAAAVLDVRPTSYRNALSSLGRPVVRWAGRTHLAVRQDLATALGGRAALPPAVPPISVLMVRELVRDASRDASQAGR
jgi:hypothetical protein